MLVKEVSYRPLIEDMTWSYSRLKSFEDCPYRWFCHYIRGEQEAPMFYASYGSFLHSILGRFYDGELEKDDLAMEFLSKFTEEVKGERPAASTVVKYIQTGLEFLKNMQPMRFRTIGVEKELHFDLEGFPFVAFVDYIGEENGKIAVVDHKSRELKKRSGRKKPTAKDLELDEMLRQLYIYSHGIYQITGEFPTLLCFNCFRNGEFIEEPFNETDYHKSLDWAARKIEEIASEEEFRPYVDYFQCKYLCGMHDDCCFWGGR